MGWSSGPNGSHGPHLEPVWEGAHVTRVYLKEGKNRGVRAPGPSEPHMGQNCPHKGPHGTHWSPYGAGLPQKASTWDPLGPYGPELFPKASTWAGIAPESLHMGQNCSQKAPHGPLGPLWGGFGSKPSRATAAFLAGAFFSCQKTTFFDFGPKNGQKKLRLRGWDLSSEICAGILHRTPPRMSKMVGWRPIW